MRGNVLVALLIVALAGSSRGDDPEREESATPMPEVAPKAADGDAPLPVGFPEATRPGVIEVKAYPAYRSAVAEGERMTLSSSDFLFWPLFSHIEKNHIAMTAPVINTFKSPGMLEKDGAKGEVSMEFLYREPTLGETGPDGKLVKVVDHPASQFVCLGVQGGMSDRAMREGVSRLRGWLDEHKQEWTAAGPPRRLGYHGPMTPTEQRLWEVQVPIKPAGEKGTEGGKNSDASDA